ncbi:MAG: ATP-binding protein [Myxococcales bacterium]|nr:ATP-binding protein [Myxococcales bacterium]
MTQTHASAWQRAAEQLIPAGIWLNAETQRRARIAAATALLVVTAASIRSLSFALAGSPIAAAIFALTALTACLALRTLRRGGSIRRARNLLLAIISLAIATAVYHRGGFGSPVLAAIGVVPLFATLLGGRRAGLLWLAPTLLMALGFSGAEALGVDIIDRVPEAKRIGTTTIAYLLVPIVLFAIASAYDWSREQAQHEMLQAERARVAAVEQARALETDRIVSLGMLAAGVGHEINNPLSVVIANLGFLSEDLRDALGAGKALPQEIAELLDDTTRAAERIARITSEMKLFAHVGDEAQLEMVDVRAVMGSALSLLHNEIRHRARLQCKFEEVPVTLASSSRLGQVFVNLLTNAAQAIALGSAEQDRIEVTIDRETDGSIRVRICDSGHGMTPQVQKEIFKPFYTTKPKGEGTGLGLAICKDLIGAMGGTITVESEVDKGSCFTVSLPVVSEAARTSLPDLQEASFDSTPKARVLIVEDQPSVAQALARFLPEHETTVAASGLAGLELLEGPKRFDVVFCDLMIPDLGGIELYQHVAQARPELERAFVFMTGGVFTPEARRFVEHHRERCIDKPFDAGQVHSALAARLLQQAPDSAEAPQTSSSSESASAAELMMK